MANTAKRKTLSAKHKTELVHVYVMPETRAAAYKLKGMIQADSELESEDGDIVPVHLFDAIGAAVAEAVESRRKAK